MVSYIDPFGLSADGAEWLKQGGSFVADAIPFVGTAKGIQEVFTGVDVITGQQLSVTDRVAAGGGTLLSWLPGGKVAGKWAVKGTASGGTWLIGKLGKIGKTQVNEIEVAEKQSLRLKLDLQLFAKKTGSVSPEIVELHTKLDDLAEKYLLPQFREIDPNLTAGYTGSFKTGTVGNPNKPTYGQPINLSKYDIDYFIESDILYEQFGNSLKANPEFRKILSKTPGFEGLKPNKAGFSIKFKPSNN
ncbi:pre-toxin TG domain-containing protein [Paenibacillus hunanensis]|uniref:pre-toxin TG domain-containing protein n=1 Tax=Paenibacillus hunanensis TaxID=539262 RepID=UPI003570CD06